MSRIRQRAPLTGPSPTPTIKDVAAQAGVSTATVSRVLAGLDGVRPTLQERVHAAVHQLNYSPNRIARNLRIRRTRTVALVVSDIQNPFFTSVVGGIENALQQADYTLLLGNSDENLDREQLYLATLRAEGVVGIILAPTGARAEAYEHLHHTHLPMVVIDRCPPRLHADSVAVNNSAGAFAAVTHLARLGHRRIGCITGPQALRAHDLPVHPSLIRYADFRQPGGSTAMQALLELPEPPTAVFVGNNLMTLGALQTLHERGLQIPSDMAIVGFDDMAWASSLQPPLTAVVQPTYEVGTTAAHLLLARLNDPQRPLQHVVLDTRLMVRASCGAAVQAGITRHDLA
jgi:LacI family transcriptional regulator